MRTVLTVVIALVVGIALGIAYSGATIRHSGCASCGLAVLRATSSVLSQGFCLLPRRCSPSCG